MPKITQQYPGGASRSCRPTIAASIGSTATSRAASSASPATCARRPARPTASTSSRRRRPGRTARSIRRRSSSTSCAASTAACASRPARCDAIELTTLYDLTGLSREEMMFDKEKLLSVFDETVKAGTDPVRTQRAGWASLGAGAGQGLTDRRRRRRVDRAARSERQSRSRCCAAHPEARLESAACGDDDTSCRIAGRCCSAARAAWRSTCCCRGRGRYPPLLGRPARRPGPGPGRLAAGPRRHRVAPETILFYVFSAIAIVVGVLLVTQRNPARAALSFALVVLSTCGLFLLLAAPFLMAATIIIYAGAIIVTFLFVLMLAQQEGFSDADDRSREPLLATHRRLRAAGRSALRAAPDYDTADSTSAAPTRTSRTVGGIEDAWRPCAAAATRPRRRRARQRSL